MFHGTTGYLCYAQTQIPTHDDEFKAHVSYRATDGDVINFHPSLINVSHFATISNLPLTARIAIWRFQGANMKRLVRISGDEFVGYLIYISKWAVQRFGGVR